MKNRPTDQDIQSHPEEPHHRWFRLTVAAILGILTILIAIINFIGGFEPFRESLVWLTQRRVIGITLGFFLLLGVVEVWTRGLGRSIRIFSVSYKALGPVTYGWMLGLIVFVWGLYISTLLFPIKPPAYIFDKLNYLIVLDATGRMQDAFSGSESKWAAAKQALSDYLHYVPDTAKQGLIIIGSDDNTPSAICNGPTQIKIPIAAKQRETIKGQINQIKTPQGQGSLANAVELAWKELEKKTPADEAVILYIVMGGGEDCGLVRDQWKPLLNVLKQTIGGRLNVHANIILLANEPIDEAIANDINVEIHRLGLTNVQVLEAHDTNELNNVVSTSIAAEIPAVSVVYPTQVATVFAEHLERPTAILQAPPINTPITIIVPNTPMAITIPPTQQPSVAPMATSAPTFTKTVPPTFTLTTLPTFTPIPPSLTPSLTPTPSVVLLSADYVDNGAEYGCDANIHFQVIDGDVTGVFRVWNAWYDTQSPPYSEYAMNPWPVGDHEYKVDLGGHPAEYYAHEVWFVYNGIESNHLSNLICTRYLTPTP